jgi:hypothetical protein
MAFYLGVNKVDIARRARVDPSAVTKMGQGKMPIDRKRVSALFEAFARMTEEDGKTYIPLSVIKSAFFNCCGFATEEEQAWAIEMLAMFTEILKKTEDQEKKIKNLQEELNRLRILTRGLRA